MNKEKKRPKSSKRDQEEPDEGDVKKKKSRAKTPRDLKEIVDDQRPVLKKKVKEIEDTKVEKKNKDKDKKSRK